MPDEKEPEVTSSDRARTSLTYSEYVKRFRKEEFQTVKNLIGELLVQFQNLEATLRSGVAYFVNPNDDVYGAIVTEKLSFKFLARAFLNLLEYHIAKNEITIDWELAEKVIAQCTDCDEKRNGIVHALYYPTEAGPTRYKANWRPGKEPAQPVPMSEAELRDLISKTVSARLALSALFYWYFPTDKPESIVPKSKSDCFSD
jgi:hypothetical protein